ncbi:MAG: hypothetical protein HUK08_10025, partial [Bacteroidaceae bacterium]|nr:hypothetical protein [Bacteroidaceae bacterium]
MRKLYSFITMLLCAMCSLTMQAQTTTENIDFTFCLQIDDPSCWVLRDINSTIVSLQAGENVLTTTLHKTSYSDGSSYAYSDTYYLSLADDKTNDYKISGCDIEVGGSRTPWSGFNGSPTSMSITFTKVEENGCTLYPACANLNDLRTATATVNVDDASKVQMRCGYFGYMPTLVDGQNTIKFNPTDEANWTIGAKNYNEYLGGVTQNGNKVTDNYGSYNLTVADNDVIDINTKVDDTPVAVTFSFANAGTEAAVTNVYKFVNYAREAVADWQNGFEVAPRTQIILSLDMNNYKFNTVTVNGA